MYSGVVPQQPPTIFYQPLSIKSDNDSTISRGVCVGSLFTLKDYPRDDQNRKHLVVSTDIEMTTDVYDAFAGEAVRRTDAGEEHMFLCRFTAMDSSLTVNS